MKPPSPPETVRWHRREQVGEAQGSALLAESLRVHPVVAELLAARGLGDPEVARRFLQPSLKDLPDPADMADMAPAAERLGKAVLEGEQIVVYGDYDADGATSTALLVQFLALVGAVRDRIGWYIPHRIEHGYGLHKGCIDEVVERWRPSLLVTVDCGITAVDEIRHAGLQGVDVVVVDHHQVSEELPRAAAALDPHREDCTFPFSDLSAVGVALNLAIATRGWLRERGWFEEREEPNLAVLADLVALGTVADVVPLTGANRVLVQAGLRRIRRRPRDGIERLCRVAGLDPADVSAVDLAFRLGPRINAAGRIGHAEDAVSLLLTEDRLEARRLAQQLDQQNDSRRKLEAEVLAQAIDLLEGLGAPEERRVLVAAGDGWHPGVVGIVASRLVEKYHRPTLVIALDGDRGKGSARSVPGFHLHRSLCECAEYLEDFGGHAMAAGFSLQTGRVGDLREALNEVGLRELSEEDLVRSVSYDLEIPVEEATDDLVNALSALEPFGFGNPRPVFMAREVQLASVRCLKGQHLKMGVRAGRRVLDAIAFGLWDRVPDSYESADLLYQVEHNVWGGARRLQLMVKDIRFHQAAHP